MPRPVEIVRTQEEIDDVLNWATEAEEDGTNFPGMTYEQGIRALYEWLIEPTASAPNEQ